MGQVAADTSAARIRAESGEAPRAVGLFGRGGSRPALPAGVALIVWLLVLPLALAGLGFWQAQRAETTLARYGQSAADLPQTLAEIRGIVADDPMAAIRFGGEDGETYMGALAVAEVEHAIDDVSDGLQVSQIRRPLAWGTVGFAALAFLGGALGLGAATVAGLRARRSRDQLVRSFARLRAILPFLLALVVIGFSFCAVCATLFEGLSLWFWDGLSANGAKLAVMGLILAGLALYSAFLAVRGLREVFALFTPDPIDASGRVVEEAQAPGLWRFVRDVAREQHAAMPDTVIVGLTDGFYVTESPVRLWPEDKMLSGRILHLPAPYLELLDEAEISAIVGHELAHFAGEDTLYSRSFTPIYAGFWRALRALQAAEAGTLVLQPAVRLGFHAIQSFDVAVAHWSRLRELEADRNGSLGSGPLGATSALIRTGVVGPVVAVVLDRAFAAPDACEADLVAATSRLASEHGFPDPADTLEDRQPHPTDSHPPTRQRIVALGVAIDDAILARATRLPDPALRPVPDNLFADWAGLCRALSRDFLENAQGARARRREGLEAAAAAVAEDDTVLYDATKPMIWMMVIVAVIFGGFGASVFLFAQQIGFGHDAFAQTIVGAVTATGAVAALLYAWFLHRKGREPLITLTPDRLISMRFREPIPWTDIAEYTVFASNRLALRVALHPDAPLPSRASRFTIGTKVDRRRRIVTLGALGIRGMKATDFSDLVGRYHAAAYARRELAGV